MAETNPASPPPFSSEGVPTLQQLVDYFVEQITDPGRLKKLETSVANAAAVGHSISVAGGVEALSREGFKAVTPVLKLFIEALLGVLKGAEGTTNDIAKIAIDAVLGEGPKRAAVPGDVGRLIINKLAPPNASLEPSIEGAENYMALMVNLQMETWLLGMVAELFGDAAAFARGSTETLQTIAELRDVVTQVFGGGRVTRRVLAPFIDDAIIAPSKRWTARQYRPNLLSPSDAVRQQLRGRWTAERMNAELAEQGWSDDRIEALVNGQRKFFGTGDVRTLVDREHWTHDQGIQHLRDQGYDEDTASDALRLEGLRIFQSHEAVEAGAIITSYASHDIERADFLGLLDTYVTVDTQRALYEELGELRRKLFIKHLTSTEAAACVKAGVLAYVDYRAALTREGYDDQAVTAKELLLRVEIDKQKSIDDHRKDLDAEKAAAKQAAADVAAAKKQQVEADRALKRRGPISDLERAAIRGLIPFARVEEVLGADYDPDTVDILVGLMEQDRQTYLAQQAAAAAAKQRALNRNVDVGSLEDAVLHHVIPIATYQQRLIQLSFTPDDAQLLADVLAAKLKDQETAQQTRDDAAAAAAKKHIDLGRFERLVRLGARPVSDYDALLQDLGFDDPSRAAMDELLNLEIAQDRKADQAKADAQAKLTAKGLSFDQFRRAVILGTKSVDQFNTFLVQQGFTADAVATLVADVEAAVADAGAARARRAAANGGVSGALLPLSTVARAARLGIITPEVYQQRLVDAGYSADDVAIDMELLAVEIADVTAQRARRDELEASTGDRGLSLATLETAVKKGEASVEDYRARAASLNYSAEDVALLVALLEDELAGAAGGGA